MTDRNILRDIEKHPMTCTLWAMRTNLIESGEWDEAVHGPAFDRKYEALKPRWYQ